MDDNKYTRVPTRIHTRKLDRSVARYMMNMRGLQNVAGGKGKRNRYGTKKDSTHGSSAMNTHDSYFSKHWRDYQAI